MSLTDEQIAALGRDGRAQLLYRLLDAELDATRRAAMRAKVNGIGFGSHVAAGKHIVRAHKAVAEALTMVIANDSNEAATFAQHLAREAELARSVGQLQAARAFEQRVEGTVFGTASAPAPAEPAPRRAPPAPEPPRPAAGRSIRRRVASSGEVQPAAPGLFDKP